MKKALKLNRLLTLSCTATLCGGMVLLCLLVRIHRILPAKGPGKHLAYSIRMIDDRLTRSVDSLPQEFDDSVDLTALISLPEPIPALPFLTNEAYRIDPQAACGPHRLRPPPTFQ